MTIPVTSMGSGLSRSRQIPVTSPALMLMGSSNVTVTSSDFRKQLFPPLLMLQRNVYAPHTGEAPLSATADVADDGDVIVTPQAFPAQPPGPSTTVHVP